jgi:RimJ/RimL family protein N-acetyltransferase
MKIEAFGVILKRLHAVDLEMVRRWRNDPKIRTSMFFQEEITSESQQRWFLQVNNPLHYYFVIYHEQQPLGLIHLSDINKSNLTAYAGLFVYEDRYLHTDIPSRASLAMLHVFLSGRGMKTIYAKVRGENQIAHRYNTMLGFEKHQVIENGNGVEYMLQAPVFEMRTTALRQYAVKPFGNRVFVYLDEQTKASLPGIEIAETSPVIDWITPAISSANPST